MITLIKKKKKKKNPTSAGENVFCKSVCIFQAIWMSYNSWSHLVRQHILRQNDWLELMGFCHPLSALVTPGLSLIPGCIHLS